VAWCAGGLNGAARHRGNTSGRHGRRIAVHVDERTPIYRVGLGVGERLRPGGVLLPRLVTGVGLVLTAGEEDRGEDRGALDEAAGDTEVPGAGMITGLGTGWLAPAPASPEGFTWGAPEAPASRPGHGMNDALGPPSSPTAITARQADSPAHTPSPSRRIRFRRRPETSVNTGAWPAGGPALRRAGVGISDRQTARPLIPLHAAGRPGLSGHCPQEVESVYGPRRR
jgi:hypothetical protein